MSTFYWLLKLATTSVWFLLFVIMNGVVVTNADEMRALSYDMQSIYNYYMASSPDINEMTSLVWKDKKKTKLLVEVMAKGRRAEQRLQQAFTATGFNVTGCSRYQCSGYLPMANFPMLKAQNEVKSLYPSLPFRNQAGSVVSEALKSLKVDLVRLDDPTLNGTGLSIGIMSDSFDRLGGYAADISTGDLPNDVKVVKEYTGNNPPPSDEGRAMAQLIHDLAPGAKLFYRTAFEGANDFAAGIQELAGEGCDVIVDDIVYFGQPYFQDGVIAQAADKVARDDGVPYFSSAGNAGANSWQGPFVPSGVVDGSGCELHDFGGGITRQGLTQISDSFYVFQWDDPFYGDTSGATRIVKWTLYAQGTSTPIVSSMSAIGDVPFFAASITGTGVLEFEISLCSGEPPSLMKWIAYGLISNVEFDTKSSTSFGHKNTEYTAGVGAAFFRQTPAFDPTFDPPVQESFSSRGGTPILFNVDGTRKQSSETRMQPRFVATDGCITTFFGRFETYPPNGLGYYFFGTSAAAPHAAAVALLLLQVNPTLAPLELYSILEETAIDMNVTGFDFDTGHGYIDAKAAVDRTLAPGQEPTLAPEQEPTLAPIELPSAPSAMTPTVIVTGPDATPVEPPVLPGPTSSPEQGPSLPPAGVPSTIFTPAMTPSDITPSMFTPSMFSPVMLTPSIRTPAMGPTFRYPTFSSPSIESPVSNRFPTSPVTPYEKKPSAQSVVEGPTFVFPISLFCWGVDFERPIFSCHEENCSSCNFVPLPASTRTCEDLTAWYCELYCCSDCEKCYNEAFECAQELVGVTGCRNDCYIAAVATADIDPFNVMFVGDFVLNESTEITIISAINSLFHPYLMSEMGNVLDGIDLDMTFINTNGARALQSGSSTASIQVSGELELEADDQGELSFWTSERVTDIVKRFFTGSSLEKLMRMLQDSGLSMDDITMQDGTTDSIVANEGEATDEGTIGSSDSNGGGGSEGTEGGSSNMMAVIAVAVCAGFVSLVIAAALYTIGRRRRKRRHQCSTREMASFADSGTLNLRSGQDELHVSFPDVFDGGECSDHEDKEPIVQWSSNAGNAHGDQYDDMLDDILADNGDNDSSRPVQFNPKRKKKRRHHRYKDPEVAKSAERERKVRRKHVAPLSASQPYNGGSNDEEEIHFYR